MGSGSHVLRLSGSKANRQLHSQVLYYGLDGR